MFWYMWQCETITTVRIVSTSVTPGKLSVLHCKPHTSLCPPVLPGNCSAFWHQISVNFLKFYVNGKQVGTFSFVCLLSLDIIISRLIHIVGKHSFFLECSEKLCVQLASFFPQMFDRIHQWSRVSLDFSVEICLNINISCAWYLLSFLDLWIYSFHQIWKNFDYYFLNYFSSSLLFWDFSYIWRLWSHILYCLKFPCVTTIVCLCPWVSLALSSWRPPIVYPNSIIPPKRFIYHQSLPVGLDLTLRGFHF